MTLHIFNPDHDLALASGLENFTAPHAGRQLRHDLAWLPALWAEDGDTVIVDSEEQAQRGMTRLKRLAKQMPAKNFSTIRFGLSRNLIGQLEGLTGQLEPLIGQLDASTAQLGQAARIQPTAIAPWGWNAALRAQLIRTGVSETLLPTLQQMDAIRRLSHRRTAAQLLKQLREASPSQDLTGTATECFTIEEVESLILQQPRLVLKAPWSSSGRGVRFVAGSLNDSVTGWLRNVIRQQGSIMAEPYYNKVKDFGMEFTSDGMGHVSYLGLSLFHTQNGAYTGNLLATETYKQEILSRYLPASLLTNVQESICRLLSPTIGQLYKGPFGIDMMVVSGANPIDRLSAERHLPEKEAQIPILHPCVEINLRRTMGHVALALTRLINPQNDDELVKVMRIVYEDNQYKLKCNNSPFPNKNTGKKTRQHTF